MNPNSIDKYKSAWKKEKGFLENSLSKNEISVYLKKRSRSIDYSFRSGLIMDLVLKSLIGISVLVLMTLFKSEQVIIFVCTFLTILIVASGFCQLHIYRQIPNEKQATSDLRSHLVIRVNFFEKSFIKAIYVAALSNSLLFISGSMYYFYSKYGEMRPFETDDYIVFGLAILIAYVLGAYIQIKQYNFLIGQLKECIQEIDEETISRQTIKLQRNKRLKSAFAALLFLILGILLLFYILSL